MEVRPELHDEYNRRVDEMHDRLVWTHPGVSNWYKDARGRVVALAPWRLVDFWKMTAALNPDAWLHAQAGLDRPGNTQIQVDLLHDYRNNLWAQPSSGLNAGFTADAIATLGELERRMRSQGTDPRSRPWIDLRVQQAVAHIGDIQKRHGLTGTDARSREHVSFAQPLTTGNRHSLNIEARQSRRDIPGLTLSGDKIRIGAVLHRAGDADDREHDSGGGHADAGARKTREARRR